MYIHLVAFLDINKWQDTHNIMYHNGVKDMRLVTGKMSYVSFPYIVNQVFEIIYRRYNMDSCTFLEHM